jgi:hypothetical protein
MDQTGISGGMFQLQFLLKNQLYRRRLYYQDGK